MIGYWQALALGAFEASPSYFLDRFGFAARMIQDWERLFGKCEAEKMIRGELSRPSYSDQTKASLALAFPLSS